MKRRDLVWCALLGCAVFYAVGAFHNLGDIAETIRRLKNLRGPEGVPELPFAPFVWRILKYVLFYAIAGSVTGAVLALLAHLLTHPAAAAANHHDANAAGAEAVARPQRARTQFWWAFALLFLGVLTYIHLRMLTLHPALFRYSYYWAWFAGSPFWVLVVRSVGQIVPLLLALYLLRKYQTAIIAALCRHRWTVAVIAVLVLAGFGAWWGKQRLPERPATNQGPNVILIALDSVRPDYLSWKGLRKPYSRPTTPNLDKFLDDCVWFDQAFVPLSRTYPSWMSLLTGCWPPTHGVRFDLPPRDMLLPKVPTLAQVLKRAGYKTAFFLDNTNFAWIEPELGFDVIVQPPHNAVDFYISTIQPPAILYYYFLNNRLGFHYDPGLRNNAAYRAIHRPEFMEREIARFARRMRHEPKFLAGIHLCSIHVPFCVSYPYSTMFRPSFGPVLNRFGYRPLLEQILLKQKRQREFSEQETSWIFTQEINLYDALVRSADDSFGAVIDAIRQAGLYHNSYILFFADHGEHLPEPGLRYLYGSSTHGFFLWGDQDTRIPLAIKFPQERHAGRKVERLVRTIDVAPTLLADLGLTPLEHAEGLSRMPDILGPPDDRERWAYGETGLSATKLFVSDHLAYEFQGYPELHEVDPETLRIYKRQRYMPNLITAKDRMIRTERWKLISYPVVKNNALTHDAELFDLAVDPNCCRDVKTSHPEVLRELGARLQPFVEQDLQQWGTGRIKGISASEKERALSTRF